MCIIIANLRKTEVQGGLSNFPRSYNNYISGGFKGRLCWFQSLCFYHTKLSCKGTESKSQNTLNTN